MTSQFSFLCNILFETQPGQVEYKSPPTVAHIVAYRSYRKSEGLTFGTLSDHAVVFPCFSTWTTQQPDYPGKVVRKL